MLDGSIEFRNHKFARMDICGDTGTVGANDLKVSGRESGEYKHTALKE